MSVVRGCKPGITQHHSLACHDASKSKSKSKSKCKRPCRRVSCSASKVASLLTFIFSLGTGPVTYCSETEKDRFVRAIAFLSPHSGGDCPELTFKGMSDAIDEGPQPDSPLYVFTDAGPKDATEDKVQYLQEIAQAQGIVVNFFVAMNTGCARNADVSTFRKIAQATMGQVFELKDSQELDQLQGLTATSLGGTAVVANAVSENQSARKKRSSSKTSNSYSITVDDSIDTLVVSVTGDQPKANLWSVSLTSPTGTIATTSNLDRGTVYQISKPNAGIWNLGINADPNVKYDFFVKGSSADNIDFEYYFVRTTVRRGVSTTVPITAPLLGKTFVYSFSDSSSYVSISQQSKDYL